MAILLLAPKHTGKRNSFLARSTKSSNFVPPPIKKTPAGNMPERSIFSNSSSIFLKISSTRASIISAKYFRDIIIFSSVASSSVAKSLMFTSSFLLNLLESALPYSILIRSAKLIGQRKPIATSAVICSEPIGKTATCNNSPSSNTAKLVVAAPILTKHAPSSFCLGPIIASAAAKGESTKSSISKPVR